MDSLDTKSIRHILSYPHSIHFNRYFQILLVFISLPVVIFSFKLAVARIRTSALLMCLLPSSQEKQLLQKSCKILAINTTFARFVYKIHLAKFLQQSRNIFLKKSMFCKGLICLNRNTKSNNFFHSYFISSFWIRSFLSFSEPKRKGWF